MSRYNSRFELICQHCRKPFVGTRRHIKWCSRRCCNRAYAERHGQPPKFTPTTVRLVLSNYLEPEKVAEIMNDLGHSGVLQ